MNKSNLISNLICLIMVMTVIIVSVAIGNQTARDIYMGAYNDGYEACVEEYNLYLPFE